jgi:hypothetical protein
MINKIAPKPAGIIALPKPTKAGFNSVTATQVAGKVRLKITTPKKPYPKPTNSC